MKKVTERLKRIALLAVFSTLAFYAAAQTAATESKYGKDSVTCVTNLSLYGDYYKQWENSDYSNDELGNSAYKFWRYCLLECPKASQNVYSRGIRLVEFKLEQCKDSLKRDKYVDTLMMVYNKRIENFPNNPKFPVGYLKGRQAVDLFQYRKTESIQYYPLFKESFDLMGNKTEPTVLYGYFIATIQYWKDKHADIDLVFETYIKVNDALQYNIDTKTAEEADTYTKVFNKLEPIMLQIATCDKLVAVFEPKYDLNPTDASLAHNLVRLFELRQCTKENLYFKALAQVHKIDPNASSAYSMGKMSVERGFFEQAENYLLEAIELIPDSQTIRLADSYLLLADIYSKEGKLSKSRDAARSVLKYRPDDAFAYLIIGELYVKAGSSCAFKDLPVSYWLAADQFAKAVSVAKDDKIRDIAQKQLNSIRRNFPLQQDIFMRSLSEGQSFTVECWINETTTVRARKE